MYLMAMIKTDIVVEQILIYRIFQAVSIVYEYNDYVIRLMVLHFTDF